MPCLHDLGVFHNYLYHILEGWQVPDVLQDDIKEAIVIITIVSELYDFLLEINVQVWNEGDFTALVFLLGDWQENILELTCPHCLLARVRSFL